MNFPLMLMSFCVGILIGLTSMGGAALMAPFLILVVGIKPVTAVGTDLVYGAVTKIVGAWVHYRQGSVDLSVVKRLAVGSIPGGLVGALAVILLPQITSNAEQYVKKTIGGLLLAVAVILVVRMMIPAPAATPSVKRMKFLHEKGAIIWGAVV